ncbi:MAG: hypothetical protein ABIW85_11210 [Variovorax sp.]
MEMSISLALTWILFLALFPMAFFWLRRTWRILVRRDYAEVALKRGEPPADPARWAPYEMAINGTAGIAIVYTIVGVLVWGMPYGTWTAIAGTTIWCKLFASFALSRHAHVAQTRK